MARNERAEMRDDGVLDEGSGPRVYELGFHLDPELPQEEVKKAYQAMKSAVEAAGTLVAEGEPEHVQLAYTISRQERSGAGRRDFNAAFFSWIAYEAEPAMHAGVVAAANADTRIIRFIDLLTTKEAARHAAEVRAMTMKVSDKTDKKSEVSETELDAALEEVVPA